MVETWEYRKVAVFTESEFKQQDTYSLIEQVEYVPLVWKLVWSGS